MKLEKLIKKLKTNKIVGNIDLEILSIASDSRKMKKDGLFICIDGTVDDGHKYIKQAIANGAIAIVVQKEVKVEENIAIIYVEDSRLAISHISNLFYNEPTKKLNLIGITGTKGKTTCAYMIKSIFEAQKRKIGMIGTICAYNGKEQVKSGRTTPESLELQSLFTQMIDNGVKDAVIEVSSQGLKLNRVYGCEFNIGMFCNISRAHIATNEHPDFKDYLNSKSKLFTMCEKGIINIDDSYAKEIIDKATCQIYTLGIENKAQITAKNIIKSYGYLSFTYVSPWLECKIELNLHGKYNIYNALFAITACVLSGIDKDSIKKGIQNVVVPGRGEKVESGRDFSIIIDYAHTPDSLEKLLTEISEFAPARVVILFGCGGDRDKVMRPMMGKIAGQIAGFSIITSDNPRSENPESIVEDIKKGMVETDGEYIVITDRTEAIRYAIKNAKKDDVIILTGKGHETYQILKDKTIHYDEREIIAEILKEF